MEGGRNLTDVCSGSSLEGLRKIEKLSTAGLQADI
jgi:hypothetical protein